MFVPFLLRNRDERSVIVESAAGRVIGDTDQVFGQTYSQVNRAAPIKGWATPMSVLEK